MAISKELQMPPVISYAFIGGPVVFGALWPFLFIIITCGAISGWHSACCSGVSPRLLNKESDIRLVAYGGWLLESLIAVIALCLACTLFPQDYFAINATPSVYESLGMHTVKLKELSDSIGVNLAGKVGGIVSFSVSAANVLSDVKGKSILGQLYLFMVVYLAIFIMPIVDHGTRMARYFVQDTLV
ncbi:MAG: carbon starvation CstA family protein [Thermoproteota archaeon]